MVLLILSMEIVSIAPLGKANAIELVLKEYYELKATGPPPVRIIKKVSYSDFCKSSESCTTDCCEAYSGRCFDKDQVAKMNGGKCMVP